MSAAPAVTADAATPAKAGKKKLIILIAAVLVVVLGGGGAAWVLMKKKPVDGEDGADGSTARAESHEPAKPHARVHDPKHPPTFVPLDPFTVNLADRDSERYAQIGVTLEIDDAKVGEELKVYMPAIRNNILMAIADRTALELMGREGKTRLAEKIKLETARSLGFEVDDDEESGTADEAPAKPSKKKKKKRAATALPIKAVHFSNFIIQ